MASKRRLGLRTRRISAGGVVVIRPSCAFCHPVPAGTKADARGYYRCCPLSSPKEGKPMLRNALAPALLAAVLAAPASAQTVDDLVAQLAEARGGLDKLRAVQSLRMLGHMMLGPNAEAPVTIERKRPHSTRAELTLQGRTSVQAYDGQKAWGILPGDEKAEPLPPDMARDIGNQADIDGPLVDYKEKGNALELVGKEKFDEADV